MGSPNRKILVVEDEKDLAKPLVRGLQEEGFEVAWACDGTTARRRLDQHWDVVLLDLMLPDMPGESLLSYIKQLAIAPAIIVLTAKSRLADKLSVFRSGADDYVTKPVVFEELLERIRALLRRSPARPSGVYRYEDLELEIATNRLRVGDDATELTPKESAICRLLLSEPGKLVSRQQILQCVWGLTEEPTSNIIGIHIFNLRKKMGGLGKEAWFQTVRSAGYFISRPE